MGKPDHQAIAEFRAALEAKDHELQILFGVRMSDVCTDIHDADHACVLSRCQVYQRLTTLLNIDTSLH